MRLVINSDLKKLDTWLQGNKVSLNVAKTHSMLISTKQKQNSLKSQSKDLNLKIRENDLEAVKNRLLFEVERTRGVGVLSIFVRRGCAVFQGIVFVYFF